MITECVKRMNPYVTALTMLLPSGTEILRSKLLDDYVASLVRKELLLNYCKEDHPVVVQEEKMLQERLLRLETQARHEFPNGIPNKFMRVLMKCVESLVSVRMATYDDEDSEDLRDAMGRIVRKNFGISF